jgi:hypothetical protein
MILFSFAFSGCSTHSKQDVFNILDTFYKNNYMGNDFRTIDRTLVTKDLSELIYKTKFREEYEVEKVKKSNNPTDKPLMIEGEVFSSFYEGYQEFKIDKILIANDRAIATIALTNTIDGMKWSDEVLLIKEDGWKIDNILYKGEEKGYTINNVDYKGQKPLFTNLKSRLLYIINAPN